MTTIDPTTLGKVERTGDGATVTFERRLAASQAQVWHALTDPAAMAEWLADASVELRVGGSIEVRFSDGGRMNGQITELVPDKLLAYTWFEQAYGESHVRWELAPDADGTLLHLSHTKVSADSAPGFAGGWHHHLERLEASLAGSPRSWSHQSVDELEAVYRSRSGSDS